MSTYSMYMYYLYQYTKMYYFSGCKNAEEGQVLKQLFHRPYFRVTVVSDVTTVELCGALKVHSTYIYM